MRLRSAALHALLSSLLSLSLGAATASAECRICDGFLHCMEQTPGARLCVESPGVCSMVLPCLVGGGSRASDGGGEAVTGGSDEGLLTLSLFDAGSGVNAALETDAGALAVGDEARGRSGPALGKLAAAMLAHGRDYTVWLADAANGGFVLERAEAGGAVHVELREVVHGSPGRVLGDALLLPQDRLRVPVTVDGRARVLLVQATVVAGGRLAAEQARLRGSLERAGREIGPRDTPLLEPRQW